ncbi:MAG TPA: NYN domain-containing protein [Thermoanaerobaculia bacterium]|nr:NYN domain-containing protein [Thermoanaerobaculia bacterium]
MRPTADSKTKERDEPAEEERSDAPAAEAPEEAAPPEEPPAPAEDERPPGSAEDSAPSRDEGGEERKRSGRSRRGGGRARERSEASQKTEKPDPPERGEKAEKPDRAAKGDKTPSDKPQRGQRRERTAKAPPEPRTHDITPEAIASINRELGYFAEPAPERTLSVNDERKIALFCDLENIALGVRDSDIKKFDINLVLERLLEKGKIIVKRAYCDWERYSEYKRAFHEAAIEMLDIPQKYYSGKNSADIKMVVDALDLCYAKEHLDTFVLLSGDSDFSPLVSKLRENDKYVIGMGVKNSSSALLVDNCDEFIYYEDIWRDRQKGPQVAAGVGKKTAEAFELMIDAIQALTRENKDVLWGSMVKQTMQRKRPSFNEGYYGFGSFSELLEDAEKRGILKLKKDQRSGSYVVTGFAKR